MPAPTGVARLRRQLVPGAVLEVVENTFCRDAEGRRFTITHLGEYKAHGLDHRGHRSWIALPGDRGPAVTWDDDNPTGATCTWRLPIGGGHTITYRVEQPDEQAAAS